MDQARDRLLCMDETVKALLKTFPYEIAVKIASCNFTGTELVGYCRPKKLVIDPPHLYKLRQLLSEKIYSNSRFSTMNTRSLHAIHHTEVRWYDFRAMYMNLCALEHVLSTRLHIN